MILPFLSTYSRGLKCTAIKSVTLTYKVDKPHVTVVLTGSKSSKPKHKVILLLGSVHCYAGSIPPYDLFDKKQYWCIILYGLKP